VSKLKVANVIISDSWGEISLDSFNKGIGGREGAMIYLSKAWSEEGHKVDNFVNTEKASHIGNLSFIPLNIAKGVLTNFEYDVVIAWECPALFDQDIQTKLKMCEMQVCHFTPTQREAAEEHCDYVAALSEWHKGFLLSDGLNMPEDKVVVFPNGVDIKRYPLSIVRNKGKIGSNPKFVYSSSPDRGLWQLLQSWPYIRQAFPGAELMVAYGVSKWTNQLKWSHNRQGIQALEIELLMKQDGVRDLGKIGQDVLAKLQLEADAWLYPLDSIAATESGCITAVENAAAGNPIITTNCDCMESEFGPVGVIAELPFDAKEYADCVEYVLTDEDIVKSLRKDGREFAESRDWSKIAKQWTNFFEEKLNEK
jgi:glycosyltransferase involved in cell wall biosynthesis